MKFTADQAEMEQTLGLLVKVIPPKSTLPALQHVHIAAKRKGEQPITLTVNALEYGASVDLAANVEITGMGAVPAKTLQELVASYPASKPVEFVYHSKTNHADLSCGRYVHRLNCMPTEEFPAGKEEEALTGSRAFDLNPTIVVARVRDVRNSAANDATGRPLLTSVLFDWNGEGKMVFASCDGFRLSETVAPAAPLRKGKVAPMQAVLPLAAAEALLALAAQRVITGGELHLQQGFMLLRGSGFVFWAQLVALENDKTGKPIGYPKYQTLLLDAFEYVAYIKREELARALRSVNIVAPSEGHTVIGTFDPSAGTLRLQTASAATGRGEVLIDTTVRSSTPAPLRIAFNGPNMLDLVNTFTEDEVALRMVGPKSPIQIVALDPRHAPSKGKRKAGTGSKGKGSKAKKAEPAPVPEPTVSNPLRHVIMPMALPNDKPKEAEDAPAEPEPTS